MRCNKPLVPRPWIGTRPCRMNNAIECNVSTAFDLGAGESSSERAIRDMLCNKTETWLTSGTWMMVTSSFTQCWYCPAHKRSTGPTQKLVQSETHIKHKSSTTPQTWMQLLFIAKATTFALWRLSPHTVGLAVGPRRCVTDPLLAKADVIQAMRERVQLCQDPQTDFASSVRAYASAASLHGEEAANIFDEVGQRSLERVFQGLPSTVRNKPRPAPVNQVLVAKEHWMLPAKHTSESSLQLSHGFSTRFEAQQQPDSCQNNLSWRVWTSWLRQPPPPSSTPMTTLRTRS